MTSNKKIVNYKVVNRINLFVDINIDTIFYKFDQT
jgi:hypothetical protein